MNTRIALLALTLAAGSACASTDLYVLDADGSYIGIDLPAGTVSHSGSASSPAESITMDDDELFIGLDDGLVVRLDPATGVSTGMWIDTPTNSAAMTIVGETLYIADSGLFDATIYLYDTATAGQITSTSVSTDVTTIAADSGGLFVGGQSTTALRGTLGGAGFQFFAACGGLINSMAFDDDTMYLGGVAFSGDQTGVVYQFDKLVGGVSYTGTYGVDSDSVGLVALDGVLYVAGTDGMIDRLDPDTGAAVAAPIDTGLTIVDMIAANAPDCAIDFTADGVVDSGDLGLFITLYLAGDLAVDLTADGVVDAGDIGAFIGLFLAGC